MYLKCIAGGLFLTNCYIIGDDETGKGILVDPGEQIDDILFQVEKSKLDIEKIVNTHTHIDHVAGVERAKRELGIPFFIHRKEQPVLDLLPESAKRFPQFGGVEVPEVEGYVEEGEIIKIGNLEAEVILLPGHTWGSICFIISDIIISGDTLFAGSVGRVDLTGGTSMEELVGGIKNKLLVYPDSYRVFPGHGPDTTIGIEKRTNPFLQRSGLTIF